MKARNALIGFTTALAFCFSVPVVAKDEMSAKDTKRLELLQAHAGEEQDTVRFLRPMHGYEIVGPQKVLVWETPHKGWLLDVRDSPACKTLNREWWVGVEALYDTINTRNGYLVGKGGLRCKITSLREVDVMAWKQAERDAGIRE